MESIVLFACLINTARMKKQLNIWIDSPLADKNSLSWATFLKLKIGYLLVLEVTGLWVMNKTFRLSLALFITAKLRVVIHRPGSVCCIPISSSSKHREAKQKAHSDSVYSEHCHPSCDAVSRRPTGPVVPVVAQDFPFDRPSPPFCMVRYTFLCPSSTWARPFPGKFAQYSLVSAVLSGWDYVLEAFRTDY